MSHVWMKCSKLKNRRYWWICDKCGNKIQRYRKPSSDIKINQHEERTRFASKTGLIIMNSWVGKYMQGLTTDETCEETTIRAVTYS